MSDQRSRYSSAPLQNYKRSPRRTGAPQPPRKVGDFQDEAVQRNFALLQILLTLALPILFVVSLLARSNTLYLVFALAAAGSLAMMWLLNAFVPNARTTLSILHIAMILVVLFALWMSNPTQEPPRQQISVPAGAQQGDLQSIFSEESSASMVNMTVQDNPAAAASAAPVSGSASAAQQQLEQFMAAWIILNYDRMVELSLPTWVSAQQNPKQAMFQIRANRSPVNYEFEGISGSDADNTRTVSMIVTISKNNGEAPLQYPMQVLMVRVNDVWYVDPQSLGSGQPLARTDGATAVPVVTVAPLVTSAPSMMLYYNPDGGRFYHVDNMCPTIKSTLLPLTSAFTFSQINDQPFRALEPCGNCHAPRRDQ